MYSERVSLLIYVVLATKDGKCAYNSSNEDYDEMEEETREIQRASRAAVEGIAPEYHIELRDRPAMVWDFHSLLLAIQMMFSFMLVDETATLKLCDNCYKAFFMENEEDDCCDECEIMAQE